MRPAAVLRGYFDLRRGCRLAPQALRQLQETKLRRIVTHAYATVPFYRDLWGAIGIRPSDIRGLDDLRRLPVVSKAALQAAGEDTRRSQAFPASSLLYEFGPAARPGGR